jgi:hypothetical protein
MTTPAEVRAKAEETVTDIIDDYKDEPETDRETLIDRMDEECDTLFGRLVKQGRIDQYTVDDLVETAADCAAIIKLAEQDAWVEDDHGLWDGLTYGVLASIAYFSLRNLLYQAMKDAGHDSNEDRPFSNGLGEEEEGGEE